MTTTNSSTDGSCIQLISKIPHILPHERVFPIQIGSELFKLSGASISSDAPSYFSQYFKCQLEGGAGNRHDSSPNIRTLYIDRDPVTFRDISLHLQGYHVIPRDGTHFVRLFADAQFYSLPKLISQLYEESIFISIGHREFQIPRDLFKAPGNSPNYFSLGFAMFFSSPGGDLFPGLDREGLLRPPSIMPPSVPNRSAETFAELLHLLRGYPVHIRNEAHRASLLEDCRYFNFKGLEQRLIPHSLSFNQARRRHEIALRLEHILKSGVGVTPPADPSTNLADPLAAWITYERPYVPVSPPDRPPAELVLEIGSELTRLHPTRMRVEFLADARLRVARLLEVAASKLANLPPTRPGLPLLPPLTGNAQNSGGAAAADGSIPIVLGPEASVVLDGEPWNPGEEDEGGDELAALNLVGDDDGVVLGLPPARKRRWVEAQGAGAGTDEWVVRTGQWRLRFQSARNGQSVIECVFIAVKLDALSSERARNASRVFLSG